MSSGDKSRRMVAMGEAFKLVAAAVFVTAFVAFALWAGVELRDLNRRVENIQDTVNRLAAEGGGSRDPDQPGKRRAKPSTGQLSSSGALPKS